MQSPEDIWLRCRAAQETAIHVTACSAALAGIAGLQCLRLGWTAPQSFWSAMARAVADGSEQ